MLAIVLAVAGLVAASAAPAADVGANDDTGKWTIGSGTEFFSRPA
jgi:hypothetical protein